MITARALIAILALAGMASCGGGASDRADVPRRKAYPRIEVPDSAYRVMPDAPMSLQVNASAEGAISKSDASGVWVDVTYPGYDAELHYTFTPVTESTVAGVVDNRVERMALNLGGNEAESMMFTTPEGIDAQVLVAKTSVSTPVQFLATDGSGIVVSGVAYLPMESKSAADSLRPVLEMLERDVIHSLKTLQR